MTNAPSDSVREISIEEFDEMIENHDDVLVVDVREAEEFHRGHFHRCVILLRSKGQGAPSMLRPLGMTMLFALVRKVLVLFPAGRRTLNDVVGVAKLRLNREPGSSHWA